MVHTKIVPEDTMVNVSFRVPKEYIGKEVEVIAFTQNEGLQSKEEVKKTVSFTALSIDTKGYKFNRDEANER
jgi:hypothetical protein